MMVSTLPEDPGALLKSLLERDPLASPVEDHATAVVELSHSLRTALNDLLPRFLGDLPTPAEEVVQDLLGAGGKRLRPLLAFFAAGVGGGEMEKAWPMAMAVELLHTGTLLHDDVIDEADTRRGRMTARKSFSNGVAVLSGDFALFSALDVLVKHGDLGLLERAMHVARSLAAGELQQLKRRGRFRTLDEEVYFQIIRDKTAALFSFACWGGARCVNAPVDVTQSMDAFGEHIGLAFQIVDDLIDLEGDPQLAGKALGQDLAEGIVTLPVLEAVKEDPHLEAVLASHSFDAGDIIQRIRDTGGPDRARHRARTFCTRASDALNSLPDSIHRRALLGWVDAVLNRSA
jgi:octaprenyl-diphosphate synthase